MKNFCSGQILIFDLLDDIELKKSKVKKEIPKRIISDYIKDMCLVYLVFQSGGNGGNLFILKKDDAIKLCSDDCSKGRLYNHEYIYMWTTLEHFINYNAFYDNNIPEFVFIKDNGSRDKDFERLGIIKPTENEYIKIINELGYKLKFKQ